MTVDPDLIKTGNINYGNATIVSGQSLTEDIDLTTLRLIGIIIPSAWTTANLTFQVSHNGSNYYNFYNDIGGEVTISVSGPNTWICFDPSLFSGIRFLRIRSGTGAGPVNQGANRLLTLVSRPI